MELGHAVELMAIKFLLGLIAPCLDLANLNILKGKPPCFSLELIVAFAYQPQYLAIELRIENKNASTAHRGLTWLEWSLGHPTA